MNDFHGNIVTGAKKISVPINLRENPGGSELIDVIFSDVVASYWRANTTPVPISVIALASLNDPHTPGGWFQVSNTTNKGLYRLDVPDAAWVSNANWVIISVSVDGAFTFNERYNLEDKNFIQAGSAGFDNSLTNCYVTVSGANDYFDTKFNSAIWESVSSEEKQRSLIEATRLIDQLAFKYDKTDSTQYLQFPRNSKTEIPNDIKIATCEIAVEIIDGFNPNMEMNNINIMSHGYGSTKTQYDRSFVMEHLVAGIPSSVAWRHLKPYLRDPNLLIVNEY